VLLEICYIKSSKTLNEIFAYHFLSYWRRKFSCLRSLSHSKLLMMEVIISFYSGKQHWKFNRYIVMILDKY
jgi:hypothetical protein